MLSLFDTLDHIYVGLELYTCAFKTKRNGLVFHDFKLELVQWKYSILLIKLSGINYYQFETHTYIYTKKSFYKNKWFIQNLIPLIFHYLMDEQKNLLVKI